MRKKTENGTSIANRESSLTEGSLGDKILFFSLPIVLTNILQQLFNTADIAIVGRFVGNDALAAVGASASIVALAITVFSGLSVGANAVIARMIGQGDEQELQNSVHTAIAIALASGLLIMLCGELLARPLLELVSTPEAVMEMAVLYLRIYFAGSVFITLYNFEAAILRADGDTRRPLYVLLISGILNVILNLFFVTVCHRTVDGIACATLISNILSALLLFLFLTRQKGRLRLHPSRIRFHRELTGRILLIGIPSALQGMLFNIANVIIQSGINQLGATVVAGSTIGQNIEIFLYYVVQGFGQACVTFTGQNLGAGKKRRCIQATRWCLALASLFTVLCSAAMIGFRYTLAGFFSTDREIVQIAAFRILLIVSFELANMIIEVLSGALRGLGHSIVPTGLCLFFVCGMRIAWLFLVFPLHPCYQWLFAVYPISWVLGAVAITAAYLVIKIRLLKVS